MNHAKCGAPLAPEKIDALRLLVARIGEPRTVELMGVSRMTLPRALAGLPVQRGTAALIELRLAEIGHGPLGVSYVGAALAGGGAR